MKQARSASDVVPNTASLRMVYLHDWWGATEHVSRVSARLADRGFVGSVCDLYAGRLARNSSEAGRMMFGLDAEQIDTLLRKQIDAVPRSAGVALMGFGHGASIALRYLSEPRVRACVCVVPQDHPLCQPPEDVAAVLLAVLNESRDSEVEQHVERLERAGNAKVLRSGVHSSYLDEDSSEHYDPVEAGRTWLEVERFLGRLSTGEVAL